MSRRVVITGMGIVSPIGNNLSEFRTNLIENKHGFTLEKWFPEQSDDLNVSAKVKNFDPGKFIDKRELRRSDKITHYAYAATKEALQDAGSDLKDIDPYRIGVLIGSGIGGMETTQEQIQNYHNKGSSRVSVFTIPMMIANMAAGIIAIKTGFKGVNYSPVSACSSSAHAIGEAFRMIKHGYLDAAVVGGTEACGIGFAYSGFNNMHAVTRSVDVDRASIPFDKERNGFVLGEGSGILILEEYNHAKERNAKIYTEICGYGSTCDAYHETSPSTDGSGAAKAMELAVLEGNFDLIDVNYINSHGTSTHINDKTETAAIKLAFKNHAKNIVINSTKSLTGHMLGAAGAVEAIATAIQVKENFVHKTLGYKHPDAECDLDYIIEGNRELEIVASLSNSFGFGGHNVSLLFVPVL